MTKELFIRRSLIFLIGLVFIEFAAALVSGIFSLQGGAFGLHYTFWHWMGVCNVLYVLMY